MNKQLAWDDHGNFIRIHVLDPETTSVKPVADAGRDLISAHVEHKALQREREAAQGDVQRFADDALQQAREAGAKGKTLDKKALRKKRQAALDRFEDLDLDLEASTANMRRLRDAYRATLAEHATTLASHARQEAEAALASLSSAVTVARRAGGALGASLSLMDALPRVVEGDDLMPKPVRARKGSGDEFELSASPDVHIDTAIESLGTAIGFGTRILDDLKKRDKAARLEAEADDAPDLDEDDEDDDESIYS